MKIRLILFVLCLALCTTALAADDPAPSFDVEIIVFRNLSPDDTEQRNRVSDDTAILPTEDEADLPPRRVQYVALQPDQLRMGAMNQVLLQSRDWSPILHYGWRQPVESRASAGEVRIAGSRRGASVKGSARLSLERFLRLELDLEMDPGTGISYRMQQARRLRSGEVHFFDDPQYGVIVLVSRTDSS